MTTRCAPACSQALPVKPQGVWARGIEAWAWSHDRRNLEFRRWGSSGPSSLMFVVSLGLNELRPVFKSPNFPKRVCVLILQFWKTRALILQQVDKMGSISRSLLTSKLPACTQCETQSVYCLTRELYGTYLNLFRQLRRFLRSLDGSTNTGGSPKCFTLPHVLWSCHMTKHQRMAQVGTW